MFIGVVWLVHQVQNHREATPLGITGGMLIFGGLITLLISLVVDTTTSAAGDQEARGLRHCHFAQGVRDDSGSAGGNTSLG